MGVILETIYYTGMRKYDMKLLDGPEGLQNDVKWIHQVESEKVVDFLKGQELVIITGIAAPKDTDTFLIHLIQKIYAAEASGLIVNLGPYIKRVPEEVLEFSRTHRFPVFTMPWEVKLVEFNREFCNLILHNEQEEQNLCNAYQNAIFFPEKPEQYLPVLKRNGISQEECYCMVKCMLSLMEKGPYDRTKLFYDFRSYCDRILKRTQKKYVIFRHEGFITILLPATDEAQLQELLEQMQHFDRWPPECRDGKVYYGCSEYDLGLLELSERFQVLDWLCKIAEAKQTDILYWKEIGVLSLIFSIRDKKILQNYMNQTIGILVSYDEEHGTSYCSILYAYLKTGGSMQDVADEFYIHRNTVDYHLHKIADILGCGLREMDIRVKLYLALYIREILTME